MSNNEQTKMYKCLSHLGYGPEIKQGGIYRGDMRIYLHNGTVEQMALKHPRDWQLVIDSASDKRQEDNEPFTPTHQFVEGACFGRSGVVVFDDGTNATLRDKDFNMYHSLSKWLAPIVAQPTTLSEEAYNDLVKMVRSELMEYLSATAAEKRALRQVNEWATRNGIVIPNK